MNAWIEWLAAVEWLGAMTVCALLLWAANERARIHASLRHEQADPLRRMRLASSSPDLWRPSRPSGARDSATSTAPPLTPRDSPSGQAPRDTRQMPVWHTLPVDDALERARHHGRRPECRRGLAPSSRRRAERAAGAAQDVRLAHPGGSVQECPHSHPDRGDADLGRAGTRARGRRHRRHRPVCRAARLHPGISRGTCARSAAEHGRACRARAP